MAESLVEQHPDVSSITWKFNRWQHHVDYSKFNKNKLILKDTSIEYEKINNYGLILVDENNEKCEITKMILEKPTIIKKNFWSKIKNGKLYL
jgi:UTP-glucose-1-phosphate uridylyltransferase